MDSRTAGAEERPERRTTLRLTQALAELSGVQLELDEERLRRQEAEDLFELVMSSMSDAVLMVNAAGRVVRANLAAERLFGRDIVHLAGAPIQQLLGPHVPSSPRQIFEMHPSGRPRAFETTLALEDEQRPVSFSCAVVQGSSGKILGALYAARDLSETQRLMLELETSERHWRLLAAVGEILSRFVQPVDALPELARTVSKAIDCGIAFVVISQHVVEHVALFPPEPGVTEALGRLRGRVPERPSSLWSAVHELRVVHAATVRSDYPLLGPSGLPENVMSAAVVPLRARGSGLGALLMFSQRPGGITESDVRLVEEIAARVAPALANAELKESLARLETAREVAQVRETLLAAASHDMQTPLAVLLGFLHTLETRPDLPVKLRTGVYARMSRQTRNLRRLVYQFLDYSRLGASRPLDVTLTPTDVRPIIEQVRDDFDSMGDVRLEIEDGLPHAVCDPDRFDQVLVNLVSNAVKYSDPHSPIVIRARGANGYVEVTVIDRGRGIAPADLAGLFDRFHRGRGATDKRGTGLGLHISKALVEAQGGRLTVASRVGEGSRFSIVLPSAPAQGGDAEATA